jgi:hypothetical protein
MDDDQLGAFLDEDKKMNPECNYSQTHSKSCRSINGESVCEVLRKITRFCPGKRPEDIYSNSTTDESSSSSSSSSSRFGKREGGGSFDPFLNSHGADDPFSIFESILKDFNHNFGALQRQHPDSHHHEARPGRGRPPLFDPFQRFDDDQDEADSVKKPNSKAAIDGHVTGPIERI